MFNCSLPSLCCLHYSRRKTECSAFWNRSLLSREHISIERDKGRALRACVSFSLCVGELTVWHKQGDALTDRRARTTGDTHANSTKKIKLLPFRGSYLPDTYTACSRAAYVNFIDSIETNALCHYLTGIIYRLYQCCTISQKKKRSEREARTRCASLLFNLYKGSITISGLHLSVCPLQWDRNITELERLFLFFFFLRSDLYCLSFFSPRIIESFLHNTHTHYLSLHSFPPIQTTASYSLESIPPNS